MYKKGYTSRKSLTLYGFKGKHSPVIVSGKIRFLRKTIQLDEFQCCVGIIFFCDVKSIV